jgi:hypothetical protein
MACRGLRFSFLIFFFTTVFALHSGGVFGTEAFGQATKTETSDSPETSAKTSARTSAKTSTSGDRTGGRGLNSASRQEREGNPPNHNYSQGDLGWNWNERGRTVPPGRSAAELRLRAYRQKMAMRAARAAARPESTSPPGQSHDASTSKAGLNVSSAASSNPIWVSVGPAPLASDATGDGMQNYNWVSGRATSVLIAPPIPTS